MRKGLVLAFLIFCLVALIPVKAFEIVVTQDTTITPNTPTIIVIPEKIWNWSLGACVFVKCFNEIAGEVDVVITASGVKGELLLGYWDHSAGRVVHVTKIKTGDEVRVKTWLDEDGYLHMGIYYGDLLIHEREAYYPEGASKVIDKIIVDFNTFDFGEIKIKSYGFCFVHDVLILLLPVFIAIALISALVRKMQV